MKNLNNNLSRVDATRLSRGERLSVGDELVYIVATDYDPVLDTMHVTYEDFETGDLHYLKLSGPVFIEQRFCERSACDAEVFNGNTACLKHR